MKEKSFDAVKMAREIRDRQSEYYDKYPERFLPRMRSIRKEVAELGIPGFFAKEDARKRKQA